METWTKTRGLTLLFFIFEPQPCMGIGQYYFPLLLDFVSRPLEHHQKTTTGTPHPLAFFFEPQPFESQVLPTRSGWHRTSPDRIARLLLCQREQSLQPAPVRCVGQRLEFDDQCGNVGMNPGDCCCFCLRNPQGMVCKGHAYFCCPNFRLIF